MHVAEEAPAMPEAETAMEWETMEGDEEPAMPEETILEQTAPDETMEWDIQEPEAQPENPVAQDLEPIAAEASQQELDSMTVETIQQEMDALMDESVLQDLASLTDEPVEPTTFPSVEATEEQEEWAALLGEAEDMVRDEPADDAAGEPDSEEIAGLVL
ncbi:MAG: hypothetical protein HQL96_17740 [Magnetococcales bacterium]|nr:hypothetical protein [Magnetococcales bacterium]